MGDSKSRPRRQTARVELAYATVRTVDASGGKAMTRRAAPIVTLILETERATVERIARRFSRNGFMLGDGKELADWIRSMSP